MPQASTIENTTTVRLDAPIQKVWDALTKPELIKQWFFGVDTKTDWKEGSPITHKGEWQGKTYEDKGKILKVTRPALLAVTHWSSMSGKPDRPENYERVTYELVDRGRSTDLTITEENLASEEAKAMSSKTWKGALDGLKKLVEK
jgi:uncharacterized protein YndB with AHSA1/START domain